MAASTASRNAGGTRRNASSKASAAAPAAASSGTCKAYRAPLIAGTACCVCGFPEAQHFKPSSTSPSPSTTAPTTHPSKAAAGAQGTTAAQAKSPAASMAKSPQKTMAISSAQSPTAPASTLSKTNKALAAIIDANTSKARAAAPAAKINPSPAKEPQQSQPQQVTARTAHIKLLEAEAQLLQKAATAAEMAGDFPTAAEQYTKAADLVGQARSCSEARKNAAATPAARKVAAVQATTSSRAAVAGKSPAVNPALTRRPAATSKDSTITAPVPAEEEEAGDQYNAELSETLSRTLLSPRQLHIREDLMEADRQMLDALGWSAAKRELVLSVFHQYSDSPHMSQEAFGKLCNARGIDMDVARLFRACDRRHHGTWLSDGDFLMAVAALDPGTPHRGVWQHVRLALIFRFYSRNKRDLSVQELRALVADTIAFEGDSEALAPQGADRADLVDAYVTFAMGDQQVLSKVAFEAAAASGKLPSLEPVLRVLIA